MDDLRPHAVPLPLSLPRSRIAEVFGHLLDGGAVEGRGEEERIRPPAVGRGRFWHEQLREGGGVGRKVAHQAMGHFGLIDACDLGERPGHERSRHAHAQTAGEQFVPDDPLAGGEPPPHLHHHPPRASLVGAAEIVDRGSHDLGQPRIGRCVGTGFWSGQHEGERFGEVAHVRVAFLDEPCRVARHVGRPLPELARGHAPQLPSAREHGERGGRVGRGRRCEVVAKGRNLLGGARRGVEPPVEVGEGLHDSSPVLGLEYPV